METYVGRARFTDDGGQRHEIHVELEEIRDGEWAGVLAGALDWDALMGDKYLVLELADDPDVALPRTSLVHVSLAVGDRASAHGQAFVDHLAEPVLAGVGSRRRGARKQAIHWHDER
jgi:hypothetical protein